MAAHEVFVGDVPQRGARSVPLAIEVFDIAVDVLFAPMKLPVETALSVGYWSDVVDNRLPHHRFSPQKSFHPNVQIRARVSKDLHRRPAVVEDAIHSVKDRSLSSKAI